MYQLLSRHNGQMTLLHSQKEEGAVFLLVAILLPLLIGILGLVLDTGRLTYSVRQVRNAADAASLAGVNQLRNHNLAGWKQVKRAALAALSQAPIFPLDSVATASLGPSQSFRFTTGNSTLYDDPGYDTDAGSSGNLGVTLTRGLFCFSAAGSREWYSLEPGGNYCWSNSVRVVITVDNIRTTFVRLFGIQRMTTSKITATAYLHVPNQCGAILCATYGTTDALGNFTAFVCP